MDSNSTCKAFHNTYIYIKIKSLCYTQTCTMLYDNYLNKTGKNFNRKVLIHIMLMQ